jgi:single-strand DNA-binding protein
MASLNKVLLIGNLGSDPEVKTTGGGQTVATLSVATNERWTDAGGMKQERTEWHKVVVWGRQADFCGQYLTKGCTVFIDGRIQTRSWDDKDGQKRYSTEIIANTIQVVSGKQSNVSDAAERATDRDAPVNPDAATIREGYRAEPAAAPAAPAAISDNDVPF